MPLEEKAFVRATTPSRYLQELTRSLLKIKHAKKYADSRVVFLAHFVIKKPVIQVYFSLIFTQLNLEKSPCSQPAVLQSKQVCNRTFK
jgi:hypothetical protein